MRHDEVELIVLFTLIVFFYSLGREVPPVSQISMSKFEELWSEY